MKKIEEILFCGINSKYLLERVPVILNANSYGKILDIEKNCDDVIIYVEINDRINKQEIQVQGFSSRMTDEIPLDWEYFGRIGRTFFYHSPIFVIKEIERLS